MATIHICGFDIDFTTDAVDATRECPGDFHVEFGTMTFRPEGEDDIFDIVEVFMDDPHMGDDRYDALWDILEAGKPLFLHEMKKLRKAALRKAEEHILEENGWGLA